MKRYRQTVEDILARVSDIETSWKDDHSEAVVRLIARLPQKDEYCTEDVERLLENDFHAGVTVVRLVLGLSKDEFTVAMRAALGPGGAGVTRFRKDRQAFLRAIDSLQVAPALSDLVNTPISWRTILIERLRFGRGSAIKGQRRGRSLEDFTERVVRRVFSDVGYDTRCRFLGSTGTSTEKADFAIPNKDDARILIESKGYGATGSKQSDILGDIEKIDAQKRHDTHLLLVTDGVTWQRRVNDLRKLVEMQNQGRIARIYTQSMVDELEEDLRDLRRDHSL